MAAFVFLLGVAPSLALAGAPCSSLSDVDAADYVKLSAEGVQAYQDGDFKKAIQKNQAAMELCDEDPALNYNLARAYHNSGHCPMAIFHYDIVLAKTTDRKLKKKVEKHRESIVEECSNAADFMIRCADEGSTVSIGSLEALPCPFTGRIKAGEHALTVSKPGFVTYNETVEIKLGEGNVLATPSLVSEQMVGDLSVRCEDGINFFLLSGPNLQQTFPCPWQGTLETGSYNLTPENSEVSTAATVIPENTISVVLSLPPSVLDSGGGQIGLKLAPGTGYADGALYDGGEATGESASSISHISFALVVEGGMVFNQSWAGIGRFRLDQNLGMVASVVGRYSRLVDDSTALHFDGGLGAGVLKQPVFLTDGRVPVTQPGPVFVSSGAGLDFVLSDSLILTTGADLYIGVYDDFALHLDLFIGPVLKF